MTHHLIAFIGVLIASLLMVLALLRAFDAGVAEDNRVSGYKSWSALVLGSAAVFVAFYVGTLS